MNKTLRYIDKAGDLAAVCSELQKNDWLAVDTEFERIRTYYPELCLLQLAGDDVTVVIDPVRIRDMEPVYTLLYDPGITKVFHAARQDLELFFNLKGSVPTPLFDTQLAAPLLGHDAFMGYANLVRTMLGVELAKSQTRTDWKRRPLRENQLRYAADDVIYLGEMYLLMKRRISPQQLATLDHEYTALADPAQYEPDPDTLWRKIREARRFRGKQLSVLQQLASWREITARKENLPRKWVLADAAIIDMARLLPAESPALAEIRGMNKDIVQKYGDALLAVIARAQRETPQAFPLKG